VCVFFFFVRLRVNTIKRSATTTRFGRVSTAACLLKKNLGGGGEGGPRTNVVRRSPAVIFFFLKKASESRSGSTRVYGPYCRERNFAVPSSTSFRSVANLRVRLTTTHASRVGGTPHLYDVYVCYTRVRRREQYVRVAV